MPGMAASVLASGVAFLQPEEAVLDAMLAGWTAQQRSRLLSAGTVEQRELQVRRFVAFTNEYPWRWSPADVEEWSADMVSRGLAHSTVRGYQNAVALFLGYATDRRYGWDHSWGSTTAVYTSVGSDFKNTALRRALDRAFTGEQ